MTYVRYRPNPETDWTVVKLSDDKDQFEVCNAVRARLFPDVKPPKIDTRFEAVMAARKQ